MKVPETPAKKVGIACAGIVGALVAVGVYWACYNGAFASAAALVGYAGSGTGAVFGLISYAAGAWVFLLLSQVFCNRYVVALDYGLAAVYAAAVLWVVLGKSVGIREVNWDLTDIFSQARYFPVGLFLNVAMFLPLGCALRLRTSSALKAIMISLGVSLALEASQYLFALGIADVCDVVANVFGTMAGFYVVDLIAGRGYALEKCDKDTFSVARIGRRGDYPRSNRVILVVLGLASLVFLVGLACYPVPALSSVPVAQPAEDTLLLKLDESEGYAPDPDGLEALPAVIDGEKSDTSVSSAEGNNLLTSGQVVGWSFWLTQTGALAGGLSLLLSEDVGGVPVSTTVPVVVAPSTEILLEGEPLEMKELEDLLYSNQAYSARVTLKNEGYWLKASELDLRVTEPVGPDVPVATFDWSSYSRLLAYRPDRETWVSLNGRRADCVEGYVASTTEFDDPSKRYMTLAVIDEADGIPILHGIDARLDRDPAWGSPDDLQQYSLVRADGSTWLE